MCVCVGVCVCVCVCVYVRGVYVCECLTEKTEKKLIYGLDYR